MLIRIGYNFRLELAEDAAFMALLRVHPSRQADLRRPDCPTLVPETNVEEYIDVYGNLCSRFLAKAGELQISAESIVADSGEPDPVHPDMAETAVEELPHEVLTFLLSSRYCEVDLMSATALELFGSLQKGWSRVQAVCGWVNSHVTFDYARTRPTKTALDVYTERVGVCRDFQHLAITFCRALNIPARYAAGYLGDIGVPPSLSPMDFSAWFEVWLDGGWRTFDARHNHPRIGRVLMATGRDAADVAITTSFGYAKLIEFTVISDEVPDDNQ